MTGKKSHLFLSKLMKEIQPIFGRVTDGMKKKRVTRLQVGPVLNDSEAYHYNSFLYAIRLDNLPARISFVLHLLKTDQLKRKKNSKFIRADYIEYHFSSYVSLLTTAFDLALGLVNETLCLGIRYDRLNAKDVMENNRVKELGVVDPLKSFQGLSGKYPGQRNHILHRGNRPFIKPLDDLILIERTIKLLKSAGEPTPSWIPLASAYKRLIPGVTAEIRTSTLEIERASTKLFNVLTPIYMVFSKIIGSRTSTS